jgi:Na+-driven multidrug efflux pump
VGFFTNELDVAILAKSLLILAAIFQLSDGIQMGALGGLRGYKDTFVPMIYLIIAYWIFALPIGYYLTYYGIENPLGAHGMWIGMIFGLSLAAVMAILRLKKLTKINPKLVEF